MRRHRAAAAARAQRSGRAGTGEDGGEDRHCASKWFAYVWRVQGIPAGDPNQATEGATMGMGAQVDDDELRVEVQRQLAAQVTMTSGTTVYWLIWGPTIRP